MKILSVGWTGEDSGCRCQHQGLRFSNPWTSLVPTWAGDFGWGQTSWTAARAQAGKHIQCAYSIANDWTAQVYGAVRCAADELRAEDAAVHGGHGALVCPPGCLGLPRPARRRSQGVDV